MPMKYYILEGTDPQITDVWIRLPHPKGRCSFTGLSRSGLNELVQNSKGKIRSVSLRKPGATKGVRLIHLPTLQAYLHEQAARQNNTRAEESKNE
jgi:hypothetical protein